MRVKTCRHSCAVICLFGFSAESG